MCIVPKRLISLLYKYLTVDETSFKTSVITFLLLLCCCVVTKTAQLIYVLRHLNVGALIKLLG